VFNITIYNENSKISKSKIFRYSIKVKYMGDPLTKDVGLTQEILLHRIANRIREIVLSLRNFSRLDEAEVKSVDIHEGLDNTLLILQHRLKPNSFHSTIELIKHYGELPLVECFAGQLNQVFMNLLCNAIDAVEDSCRQSFKSGKERHICDRLRFYAFCQYL
jgi:signal transduction histidine kinase